MYEHDPVISEYEHEKFRPREAEALQMLRKVASLVKPIMRQRGWKVGILAEFWPPEQNLLGLNHNKGQKICLRLRYPGDECQFMPIEDIVDTMLHELCHIVHGPHNEPFHTLWNQLRSEHESLIRKGYTGEGFLSTGHKLGGGRIPMQEARRRARAAAEKRRALTAGSGQKLGGTPVSRGQDIRKVIADAATRRATVTKGCASGTEREKGIIEETNRNGFKTKAEEDSANEEAIMQAYIEMIQEEEKQQYGDAYIPTSNTNPAGSQRAGNSKASRNSSTTAAPPIPTATKPTSRNSSPSPVSLTDDDSSPSSNTWHCPICTLSNPPTYLCCDACGTERPALPLSSPPPSQRPTKSPLQNQTPPQSSSLSSRSRLLQSDNSKAPRSSIHALSSLNAQANSKPLGWLCHQCGSFMESEWWTCSGCGAMKLAS